MPLSCSVEDREYNKFDLNIDGKTCVVVCDKETHQKLDDLIAATGGAVSVTTEIFNIALGAANTEQSQALPADTRGYLIRTRGNAELKISHVSGESGTKYVTIPKNASFTDEHKFTSLTIYFQSPQTGDTVEILAWKV